LKQEKLHISLSELNARIKGVIQDNFFENIWIVAEIGDIKYNRNGHAYLELIDKDQLANKIIARASANIWSYTLRMLRPYFETTTGRELQTGLKVMVSVSVEFHELYGFSLNIKDIDPTYTLGDIELQRLQIINRLTDDGVIEMNKELELPAVIQKIAIISSDTAAGYQDFMKQLQQNPYGYTFYCKLFPAMMQGDQTESSIIAALDYIYQYENFFDVVVIIRGGGAQIDLACFDQYELAFNVAQFPLPVITGIGHDKDDTVIDMVAHTRMKTPTAVAEFLISGALQFSQQLSELEKHFTELITDQLEENRNRLNDAADQLSLLIKQMIAKQTNRLDIARIHLANRSATFLKNQFSELKQLTSTTKNQTNRFVVRQNHLLIQSGNKLNYTFREQVINNKNLLKQYQKLIKIRSLESIRTEKKNINLIQEKLRLIDPQNILKRGYSLTLMNGKILKSAQLVKEGDRLETQLRDGKIESTVEKIIKSEK